MNFNIKYVKYFNNIYTIVRQGISNDHISITGSIITLKLL